MRGLFKQLKPESVGRKIFLLVWVMLIVCSLVHSVYNDFYLLLSAKTQNGKNIQPEAL